MKKVRNASKRLGVSQTRFRFTGSHEFRPGLKAGINWDVGYTSNPSSGISMANRSVDATFNERHAEVFLQSAWGKASLVARRPENATLAHTNAKGQ